MNVTPSFFIVAALLTTFAVIFIALLNYRLKTRLLKEGLIDTTSAGRLLKPSGLLMESLKWGLVLVSGGMGLITDSFISWNGEQPALSYGLEAVFVGAGFLVYYLIAKKQQIKKNQA